MRVWTSDNLLDGIDWNSLFGGLGEKESMRVGIPGHKEAGNNQQTKTPTCVFQSPKFGG